MPTQLFYAITPLCPIYATPALPHRARYSRPFPPDQGKPSDTTQPTQHTIAPTRPSTTQPLRPALLLPTSNNVGNAANIDKNTLHSHGHRAILTRNN